MKDFNHESIRRPSLPTRFSSSVQGKKNRTHKRTSKQEEEANGITPLKTGSGGLWEMWSEAGDTNSLDSKLLI